MIASASVAGVSGPKFMVPRQMRLTDRPERPRWMYSMLLTLSRQRGFTRPRLDSPVPGHPLAGAAAIRAVPAGRTPAHVHEWLAAGRRDAEAAGRGLAVGQEDRQCQAGRGEEPFGPGCVVVAIHVQVPAGRTAV